MFELIKEDGFNFAFDPKACKKCEGSCCIGESGYIWVTLLEIKTLCESLKISKNEFINKYLIKIGYRYSIKELDFNDGFKCIFFDIDKKCCSVYENRPIQCKKFPFWDYFKNNISEAEKECLGIYRL
ncbi:MAG: YkgJ family cysteine cluster protein [Sulfurospirillum sp.]|nr:YkgJ family cysteine cluster protein [Sulfurospirillum sp.]MBL0702949.1 YkgJ family cysteine cluster protein [Sulfurospirillum sp.]